MVARASDPNAEAAKRPRGWTLHALPADEVGGLAPEEPQAGPAAQAEASSDLCGRLVGARYDVRELRSHGEKAAVYLGFDRNYGRLVDLRFSAPQAIEAGDDVRGRARRRMGVRHVHLAALQGEGLTEGGLHYVAMEHVEGRNLHHMIGDPRLTWPAVHAIGTQVAEALVALHGAWVVHGAVHPGNLVWVEHADERAVDVKLVDLDVSGAAAAYGPPGIAGVEADTSADVFALAVTLYELCTGKLPDPGLAALAHADAPAWFAELLRGVLQGGLSLPSARALLASLRQSGGETSALIAAAPLVVPRAESVPVPLPRAESAPVPAPESAPRAASAPLPRAESAPVPAPRAASSPVPVAVQRLASSPVPVVMPPVASGPLIIPPLTTGSGPLPAAGATEDELWFAAVEAFDPLARLEVLAGEAPRVDEPATGSSGSMRFEPAPPGDAAAPSSTSGSLTFEAAPEVEVEVVEELEPPPEFGGAFDSREQAPAMVTMQSAFDPRPTPVPLLHPTTTPTMQSAFDPRPTPVPLPHPTATPADSVVAPVIAPAGEEARRGGRIVVAIAAALVLAVALWRFGADEAPAPVSASPTTSAAPAASAPRTSAPPVRPAAVVPAGASEAPSVAPAGASEAPPVSPAHAASVPGGAIPAAPEAAPEPPPADDTPEDEAPIPGVTREQLGAGEFRGVLLRSNRGPAVTSCYMLHTAGVEQKVEAVVRVGARGRVQKLRIEDGPLGECLREVIEKLTFPPALRSSQHQYVFKSPID
ncbi:MAG: hypothetical protein JNL82_37840 [Myxococcales bacterium]|nr:hypothetical protein [Myxococcales bacterium]